MDVQLKNIKFAEHMSEETNAFTADVYYKGKKVGYTKNDGRGGCTFTHPYSIELRPLLNECEEYCKGLPPHKVTFQGKEHTLNMDLELVVDTLFEDWLNEKEKKKVERKMKNSLLWGVPKSSSYQQVKFKRPLSEIPKPLLQNYIDKYKTEFKEGEVYLNTNLDGFNL